MVVVVSNDRSLEFKYFRFLKDSLYLLFRQHARLQVLDNWVLLKFSAALLALDRLPLMQKVANARRDLFFIASIAPY